MPQKLPDFDVFREEKFTWKVALDGYSWEPCGRDGKNKLELVNGASIKKDKPRYREYEPLEVDGLFEIFAGTKGTHEGIKAFADQFGMLLGDRDHLGDDYNVAESIHIWQSSIRAMQEALSIWRALEANDERDLALTLKCASEGINRWSRTEDLRAIPQGLPRDAKGWCCMIIFLPGYGGSRSSFRNYPMDDVQLAARFALIDLINARNFSSPVLRWAPERKEAIIQLTPTCLLGAIWWSFAKRITGKTSFRPCKVCGKPIKIGRGGNGSRKDRELCSAACGQRFQRQRRREAVRLHEEEQLTPQQIAKQMQAMPEAVKNWLDK